MPSHEDMEKPGFPTHNREIFATTIFSREIGLEGIYIIHMYVTLTPF